MYKVICGTPGKDCSGSPTGTSARMEEKGGRKMHVSHLEAFQCHARYLVSIGYKQVGSREFLRGDGPILVLTKKSRFGGRMRAGKTGMEGKGKGTGRNMPVRGAGIIV